MTGLSRVCVGVEASSAAREASLRESIVYLTKPRPAVSARGNTTRPTICKRVACRRNGRTAASNSPAGMTSSSPGESMVNNAPLIGG
ncbi:hypothetical protein OAH51_02210 [Verrucomicrobia bacterium]|nr:hypothetical protein [Verrucomicrobiota bacterium]